ncbi:MAG TPA: bifunctional 4-hydroxy-2-oxoglutarate aldolase/2-dehydro-3-deoxy-phosphogluconate aldolase [Chthoniobacteraceae bacterium]|nr:bifunctional 4-hydroxy-2-oxoglutarate aldolase/2-dehydro-3-deoxy-phosphogluconate aldolase [Chthoniobacteraceae bacterium]
MEKPEIIARITGLGVLAILRMDSSTPLMHVAEALHEGGIDVMEIPMTTPDALHTIAAIKKKFGDKIVMGVGSVLDPHTARAAILIGAQFVVTPITSPGIIKTCNRYLKPVISGAYTPTEAHHAHECGADFVKIFPADNLGPAYIKSILAPMPMLKLIPTAGVTHENAAAYLEAGSAALAVSTAVIPKSALEGHDWKAVTHAAERLLKAIKKVHRTH